MVESNEFKHDAYGNKTAHHKHSLRTIPSGSSEVEVRVKARDRFKLDDVEVLLRQRYKGVVATGDVQNKRSPDLGYWRGYFTIVLEEAA